MSSEEMASTARHEESEIRGYTQFCASGNDVREREEHSEEHS